MPWPKLREGLLQDLGYETPEDLAQALHFDNIRHLKAALAGKAPSDELMTSLLRTFPAVPAMYFVQIGKKVAA